MLKTNILLDEIYQYDLKLHLTNNVANLARQS